MGIFIQPQIYAIINVDIFESPLSENEKSAWLKFKAVCLNFLGNVKDENYMEHVENLFNAYQTMGHNMSFLTFQLGLFLPEFWYSEQQIWRMFQQDISTMEKGYAGKWSQNMLADCCWNITEQVSIVYCQLQKNELQKEVLKVINMKHLFPHFCCVIS